MLVVLRDQLLSKTFEKSDLPSELLMDEEMRQLILNSLSDQPDKRWSIEKVLLQLKKIRAEFYNPVSLSEGRLRDIQQSVDIATIQVTTNDNRCFRSIHHSAI